jgi:hypothetical protein
LRTTAPSPPRAAGPSKPAREQSDDPGVGGHVVPDAFQRHGGPRPPHCERGPGRRDDRRLELDPVSPVRHHRTASQPVARRHVLPRLAHRHHRRRRLRPDRVARCRAAVPLAVPHAVARPRRIVVRTH